MKNLLFILFIIMVQVSFGQNSFKPNMSYYEKKLVKIIYKNDTQNPAFNELKTTDNQVFLCDKVSFRPPGSFAIKNLEKNTYIISIYGEIGKKMVLEKQIETGINVTFGIGDLVFIRLIKINKKNGR